MKLKLIVKSLALAGLMTTVILPAYADVSAKDASDATKTANDALYNQLPFSDNTDFTNAHKGFIAALPTE
ncbi:MBL fold metallo-hydrolase, partial [Kluyvera cryocrescens]